MTMDITDNDQHFIIYNTDDGKTAVSLYARDGNVWMNQGVDTEFGVNTPLRNFKNTIY